MIHILKVLNTACELGWRAWSVPLIMIATLVVISFFNFLLFHTLAELFSIVIGILMAVVVWSTYVFSRNHFLMFLGCGYFWVAGLDLIHAFAYKGMHLLENGGGNMAVQYWLASRYLEAVLLLVSPLFLTRPVHRKYTFTLFGVITSSLCLSIVTGRFPTGFVEGVGLTPFKVASEYLIITLLIGAIVVLHRKREMLEPRIHHLMVLSMGMTIVAELSFTFYVSVYGLSNMIGHLFKLFSFWLIFMAIIRTTIEEPFQVLARGSSSYDVVPDSIVLLNGQGVIMHVNQAAQKMAGLAEADLLGRRCHEIFHDPRITPENCPVCCAISANQTLQGHEMAIQSRGAWRKFHVTPTRSTGLIGGRVHVASDITQRKIADEALRKSETRFFLAMQGANDGLWDWNIETNHVYYSPRWKEMLGYKNEELRNHPDTWKSHLHPDDLTRVDRAVKGYIAGIYDRYEIEFRLRHKDGQYVPILSRGSVVLDKKGKPIRFVGTHIDITERQQKQAFKRAKIAADAANHAKSIFLAMMSHEIRTSMNAILGMAELLEGTKLTETQELYVKTLNNAGETLLSLINDILDISKIEAGQVTLEHTTYNLRHMVEKTLKVFEFTASCQQTTLTIDMDDALPQWVRGDSIRLRQVLINLTSNAIKFTHNGRVTLRVIAEAMDQVSFAVTDTGSGIPKEKQKEIFQPFTQADISTTRKYGGTGLGLTICQRLVELMGGCIELESEVDQGSTFSFTISLPRVAQDEILSSATDRDGAASREKTNTSNNSLDILLVEDTSENRLVIKSYLREEKCRLKIAVNGAEAVEKFKNSTFDLVLMDIQMPVMDGYTATRMIREWEKKTEAHATPILALTAHAMANESIKIKAVGCDLHLTKPIKKTELMEAINKIIVR